MCPVLCNVTDSSNRYKLIPSEVPGMSPGNASFGQCCSSQIGVLGGVEAGPTSVQ